MRGIILLSSLLFFIFCATAAGALRLFNNTHLERLAEWFELSGELVKGYWVYAENTGSGYVPVSALNEGDFCVDDVARVVLLYSEVFEHTRNETYLQLAKDASKFVLKMHAGDGEFYNFAYKDGTINRFGPTSVKSTSWWALRAFWGLSKLAQFWNSPELEATLRRTYSALRRSPPRYGDQLSLYVLGLAEYYKATGRKEVLSDLRVAVEELKKFRWGWIASFVEFFSAYRDRLSWNGWGNHYAEAFVESYLILKDEELLHLARRILEEQGVLAISTGLIYHVGNSIKLFPEIAYALECLVVASQKLYSLTNDVQHGYLTALLSSWLFGGNRLSLRMYGPNGEGFDGLEFAHVNRNAGAESTICALRSVLHLEKLPEELIELAVEAKIVARSGITVLEAEALDPGASSFKLRTGDYGGGVAVVTDGRSRFRAETVQSETLETYRVLVSGEFRNTTLTLSSAGSTESIRSTLNGSGIFEVGKLRIQGPLFVSFSNSCTFDQLVLVPEQLGVSFTHNGEVKSFVFDSTQKVLTITLGQKFSSTRPTPSFEITTRWEGTGRFRSVDLTKAFNNDGFATPNAPGNFDNLGGVVGAYLPANEVFEGDITISGVPFRLNVNGLDNIRCSGQRIVIEEPIVVRQVHILLAANHGDYDVFISLNGTPFWLKATDWCREPLDLAFSYRYVASGERQFIKCGLKVVTIPFTGTLNELVLPNEVNVHLFAITLEVQD